MFTQKIRVGIARDFLNIDGTRSFDEEAWRQLEQALRLELEFLDQPAGSPIQPGDAERFDVLVIKRNLLTRGVFMERPGGGLSSGRLRLVVRNGAGYDHIDLRACTEAGVMVGTTPQAVAHSVASSILALMLAFSHRLFERDRQVRAGLWHRRWERAGPALNGRVLGIIGLGNIGLEVFRLAAPWGMRHLGYTPRPNPARYHGLGIELTALEPLLAASDFIAICCPLTDQTRHMIDAKAFGLMRRDAFLINTARGEIVDEPALIDALRTRRIAGAGIDVYESEPPPGDHPLFALDNVVLGSHNLAYSDQLNKAANLQVASTVLAYAAGREIENILNPEAGQHLGASRPAGGHKAQ